MSVFAPACTLCQRDPVMGGSTITSERDGQPYPFCHPVTEEQRQGWSCFEILGYVMVEQNPHGRRPPRPLPPLLAARARRWLGDHKQRKTR